MNQYELEEEIETTQHILKDLEVLLSKGCLSPLDFDRYSKLIERLHLHQRKGDLDKIPEELRRKYDCIGSDKTMQGMAYVKKYGYPGDFEIIDKIYTEWQAEGDELKSWDVFFHSQTAPIAVRNRKSYFKSLLESIRMKITSRPIKILNLASGPCRDILEFYEEHPNEDFQFTCVELDIKAIEYASGLLGKHCDKVNFINTNIFRYIPDDEYHLIWSAGLFDYFDDETFSRVLSRYNKYQYIVIGNFSNTNPTSSYMEVIGEWYLNYRSKKKLFELALKAGFVAESIQIHSEPTQTNLFLHLTND